ncbi:MAG TPA: hypothetical protein PKX00_25460, partial [Opitutaceae bacterium]|nr:hypothetical protein [Opitutaceae bacterium]
MQLIQEALGQLNVTPIQAVLGIARHAGDGMVVTRSQTFPFPACQVQVWEFTAALPPLDRPPVRVAVQFKGKIRSWIDLGEESYEDALDRYGRMSRESLAHAGRARAKAPSDAPE